MLTIQSKTEKLYEKMRLYQAKIISTNAQIQGIGITPKEHRSQRLTELQARRAVEHGIYITAKEEFERFTLLPLKDEE